MVRRLRAAVAIVPWLVLLTACIGYANCKEKAYVAMMKSDLRNLISAQDAYAATHDSTYASSVAALDTLFRASAGNTVTIDSASKFSFYAHATNTTDPRTCRLQIGTKVNFDGDAICDPPKFPLRQYVQGIAVWWVIAIVSSLLVFTFRVKGLPRALLLVIAAAIMIEAAIEQPQSCHEFPTNAELITYLLALSWALTALVGGARAIYARATKRP